MARDQHAQLNVRSTFARERVSAIVKATGMTTTQVVEEALRAYVPPFGDGTVGSLIRKGPLLVAPARGRTITLAEANAELEAARNGDED